MSSLETTLATKIYVDFIKQAQQKGYQVTLLFFWLNSPGLAVQRVKNRVQEGGHNILETVIRRRYESGLQHFFTLYRPVVDSWIFVDNSGESYRVITEGVGDDIMVVDDKTWKALTSKYYE